MQITKKSLGILLVTIFLNGKAQQVNTNYIYLEFSGDHYEKPVPAIVFNLDSFATDELLFTGYRFKVNKQEFASIENVVENGSSYVIIDSLAYRYYDIKIVKNGGKVIYGTVNLHKSKELFAKILDQLKNTKRYPEISKAFEYLYLVLKPRGT